MLTGQIEGLPQLEELSLESLDQPQDQMNYDEEYGTAAYSASKAEIADMMIREQERLENEQIQMALQASMGQEGRKKKKRTREIEPSESDEEEG